MRFHVPFSSRLQQSALALGLCVPLSAFAQTPVPAPPVISPVPDPVAIPVADPVAIEIEEKERSLIPVPGFLKPGKKDAPVAVDPLLDQTSGAVPARPDLSDMPVSQIKVPELQSVPESDLPAILRSNEEPKTESGPFGLFGKDEPASPDMPAAQTRVPPVTVEPVASEKVATLRAAETQADSFTAALAIAQDGAPATPVPAAEPVAMEEPEKEGMLSSIGGLFKKEEPAAEPVATTEKQGLFSGLLRGKDKEPEALITPVPGISDVGEPVVEAEKKGLRLPKLFGRE